MLLKRMLGLGHVVFRLRNNVSCHRYYSEKMTTISSNKIRILHDHYDAKTSNLLLNYINVQYKGVDKRLKTMQSTMDKVNKIKTDLGNLESLDDLTMVVGLSKNEAIQLCDEIVLAVLKKKRKMQLSYPVFTKTDAESIDNVMSIHTTLYHISWAHLEKSGRLLSWKKEVLPLTARQKHPIDCAHAIMSVSKKISVADVYILETPDMRRASGASLALDGFLLGNINASLLGYVAGLQQSEGKEIKLHYLNRCIVPYLFGLSVGNETISRYKVVEQILNENKYPEGERTNKYISDIVLDDWLYDIFMKSGNIEKEQLSVPFLAAIAFMETLVRGNPSALERVTGS